MTELERDFTFSLTKYPSLIFFFSSDIEGKVVSGIGYLKQKECKVREVGRWEGNFGIAY